MSSLDEIIQLYKRDVDLTLIEESLRLSVEERIRRIEDFEQFRRELRSATERNRGAGVPPQRSVGPPINADERG